MPSQSVTKAQVRISFTKIWAPCKLDIKRKKRDNLILRKNNGDSLGTLTAGLLSHSFIILTGANRERETFKHPNSQVHLKVHGIYWSRKKEENHKVKFKVFEQMCTK